MPARKDPTRSQDPYANRPRDVPNSLEYNTGYRQGLYYAYYRHGHFDCAREVLHNAILRKDNWALLIANTKNKHENPPFPQAELDELLRQSSK